MVGEDGGDGIGERCRAQPPVQPVAGAPVRPIAPGRAILRKGRKGPCIPGPQIDPVCIDHRRIALSPMAEMRLQKPSLLAVGAVAAGKIGKSVFRRFRIGKDIGARRALVHRRAAEFGEPDGLRARRPCRRRGFLHTPHPVVVEVSPPVAQVLVTEHPRLPLQPVGNRRAPPRGAVRIAGIIPVEPLSRRDRAAEGAHIVRAGHAVGIAVCGIPVAPVGKRHIVVDADGVDIRARPERIEMEEHVARTVRRLVTEIFAPVRRIGQLHRRPQYRPHIARQPHQFLDKGKGIILVSQRRQPSQLRADQESVHPASPGRQRR